MQLMEAAEVEVGDGHWTSSYQFDSIGCSLSSARVDVCAPTPEPLTGDASGSSSGRDGFIFGVVTSLKGRARCSIGMEGTWVKDALDAETEKAAGKTLWDGLGASADVYLESPDVATVASGATILETVSLLLIDYWGIATGVKEEDTLLHVGISHLLTLSNQGVLDGDQRLKGTKIRVVSSPGYAANAAAVTGPIVMKVGSDQVIEVPDVHVNDLNNAATRLVALEFDPCIAVRAT